MSTAEPETPTPAESALTPEKHPRQRIVRSGSRRARLEHAPGTDPSPELSPRREEPETTSGPNRSPAGPNDERLRRDVPPHWGG